VHRGSWLHLDLAYHDEFDSDLKRWLASAAPLQDADKSNLKLLKDLTAGAELAFGIWAGSRRPTQIRYVIRLVRDDCVYQEQVLTSAVQARRQITFPIAFRAGDVLDPKSINDWFASLVFGMLAHETTHVVQAYPFGPRSLVPTEPSDRLKVEEVPGVHNSLRKEKGAYFVEHCLRMALLPASWHEELQARLWRDRRDWYAAVRKRQADTRIAAVEEKLFAALQRLVGPDFFGPKGIENLPQLMPACARALRFPDEDVSTLQPDDVDKAKGRRVLTALRKISKPKYWKYQQYDDMSLEEMPPSLRAGLLKGTPFELADGAATSTPIADVKASGVR
jgi:hypothetical protein